MSFHIHDQKAAVINNVIGDQTIDGGQQGAVTVSDQDARELVRQVREVIRHTDIAPGVADAVQTELGALDADLTRPEPDRRAAAGRLGRVVGHLKSAGALVAAGTELLVPLTALARWLGDAGQPIIHALGG